MLAGFILCPTFQSSSIPCGWGWGQRWGFRMLGSEPRLSYIWHASNQALELSIYPNQIQCVHIDQYSHSVVYHDFAIRFLYSPLNVFPSLSAFSIFFLQMTICIGSLKISFPWWLIFEKFLVYFIIFIL